MTSGVPAAGTLVSTWQQQICCDLKNKPFPIADITTAQKEALQDFEEWRNMKVEATGKTAFESWFEDTLGEYEEKKDTLYQVLFEYLRQSKESRQSFIEEITSGEQVLPSIGYFYLASLLKSQIIGCVLTTNFDDLIADALYKYYDTRPIVCAFESSISNFNNSSTRPKVIKLHGDYLFNDIRNTESELTSLDVNMENKMIELCQDRGLVFVGYSGSDETIMDPILKQMQVNPRFLTKDLHWCIRRQHSDSSVPRTRIEKEQIPKRLWTLKRRFPKRVHIYEVDGFDEFFCDVSSHTKNNSEQCFAEASARNVSQLFINSTKRFKTRSVLHPQMSEDYEIAARSLSIDASRADNLILQAEICWEIGKIRRDEENEFNSAIEKFEEGLSLIDSLNEESMLTVGIGLKSRGRRVACQVGILKCLVSLDRADDQGEIVDALKESEYDLREFLRDREIPVSYEEEHASVLYNLICVNGVLVSMGTNEIADVRESVAALIDELSKSSTGRVKLIKLMENEPDAKVFVGELI